MIRLLALALVAAALVLITASASAETVFDLGAKAPVTNGKIWRDLLRPIFPDLRQETDKDGKIGDFIHGKVELRPVDKEAFGDDCGDDGPRIEYIDFARVEIAGQMRVIVGVTTEHDACFGALALFEGTGDRLIDAVNIQQDANYPILSARWGVRANWSLPTASTRRRATPPTIMSWCWRPRTNCR